MKFIFWTARFFFRVLTLASRQKRLSKNLVISAGPKGWESIEFKELYSTAVEWLGADNVTAVKYHPQIAVREELKNCSHYFYDPRTGYDYFEKPSRRWRRCIIRAIKIGVICAWRGITPIAYVTDLNQSDWRNFSFLVTATSGFVFCFLSINSIDRRYLQHSRITGPMPLALSYELSEKFPVRLNTARQSLISFSGSLYEPRKTFIYELRDKCQTEGYDFVINSRGPGGPRSSDDQYWKELSESMFVVSTTTPSVEGGVNCFGNLRQMVYRFSEALLTGACLISDVPDGVERYFKPGEDFVVADTADDVIEILHDFYRRPEFYHNIARRGQSKAQAMARCSFFWNSVNTALGTESIC